MHQLFLASQSPRRKNLLQSRGLFFKELHVKVSEIPNKNLNISDRILAIARQKLEAVLKLTSEVFRQPSLVLVADTEVVMGDDTFGKPLDESMARNFLQRLSGKRHQVVTAVVLFDTLGGREHSLVSQTEIEFKELSQEEIESYLKSGEWQDKAGGYAIQGTAKEFVRKINGSLENVIGLPVDEVLDLIKKNNWELIK